MVAVVIERVFAAPQTADDVASPTAALNDCMRLYRVQPQLHYLARDGMRCTCVFAAPDAEAMRQMIRKAAVPLPDDLWSATVHPGPDDADTGPPVLRSSKNVLAVVDRSFPERVAYSDVQAKAIAGAACLDTYRVRFLRSYFAASKQRMVCLYEAPDLESVRIANQKNGLPFERVWGARIVSHPA